MLKFKVLTFTSTVISVLIVVLTILWVCTYMGVVWDVSNVELYNWHSIFMVSGMVFCFGNSILVFRTFQNFSKTSVKAVHGILHGFAILFIFLGLTVEYIPFFYGGKQSLYSLHSWVGLLAVSVFLSQFIFGLVCYTSSTINQSIKVFYMPIHVFLGNFCFILSIATCLIGLNQNARFNMNYSDLPGEGVLINIIGLLMVIYGAIVIYLTTNRAYKRETTEKSSAD